TSTTPKVQYGYASGAANTIRPKAVTYLDDRRLLPSIFSRPVKLARISVEKTSAGERHPMPFHAIG
ncbi:MAG: hypothetical protein KDA59_25745, partial [Planctomycetales bacterium]|nr:hypothetical protein [Planctomycetales bacterium]